VQVSKYQLLNLLLRLSTILFEQSFSKDPVKYVLKYKNNKRKYIVTHLSLATGWIPHPGMADTHGCPVKNLSKLHIHVTPTVPSPTNKNKQLMAIDAGLHD